MTSELPAIWAPNKFDGSDLLPMSLLRPRQADDDEPLVGKDNVSTTDLVLPSLTLLQGMSPSVVEQTIEGAVPGRILHTGTQQVFKAPLRVMFVHHSKSNRLIPDPKKDARTASLQKCISRDAVRGDVYGDCETCRKCLDWDNERNAPPLGSQSHNFVALTEYGPAMMRFSRTSMKAARQFLTTWTMAQKNLWAHPVVVRVKSESKTLPDGQKVTYYQWEPVWQLTEQTPKAVREECKRFYEIADQAFQAGRLAAHDESGDEG